LPGTDARKEGKKKILKRRSAPKNDGKKEKGRKDQQERKWPRGQDRRNGRTAYGAEVKKEQVNQRR